MISTNSNQFQPDIIRAELVGSDTCIANGITVQAYEPIFEMCRKLVAAGVDPATRLECYRGATKAFVVGSIGKGAKLTVEEDCGAPRVRKWKGPRRPVTASHSEFEEVPCG